MSERIYIFDTTLRDGEQVPGCQLSTIEKIEIARQLELLGVDVIEAGFPMSSPGDFKSVVEISKAVSLPIISALSRAVEKDIDIAAQSLQYACRKRIHTGLGTSDYHIHYKFNSTREQILATAVSAVKYAKKFVEDVEFYAEDAGRTDNEYLCRVIEAVIAAGATVVNIPDTTGYCLPDEFGNKIKYLFNHVSNIDKAIVSIHCHNDLGLATANTLSGILNGARQVDVTMNGVGERAGNTALEEVVMITKCRPELNLTTGIDTRLISSTSRMVSCLMNMPIQANKAIVGRNAFAHSSGIHQDGVLKNPCTYEIINPREIGIEENAILLSARSGKSALKYRLNFLGLNVPDEKLSELYDHFLVLADHKKEITDDDILMLAEAENNPDSNIRIDNLSVTCNFRSLSMAKLGLSVAGSHFESAAEGNGPVDAAIKALKKIIKRTMTIREFTIQSIGRGSDDTGKVHMQIEYDKQIYYGFGADTDIVAASLKAYIDCINKFREDNLTEPLANTSKV